MYTTREIVEKLRAGVEVEEITAYLYGQHQPALRAQARYWGLDRDAAKDVVQEVMITFLRHVLSGRYEAREPDNRSSYLHAIAGNVIYKANRGNTRRHHREAEYARLTAQLPDTPEELALERDYLERSWETFRALCGECRHILTDYYQEKLPLAQIAARYGMETVGMAKARKFRCMQQLRKLLQL